MFWKTVVVNSRFQALEMLKSTLLHYGNGLSAEDLDNNSTSMLSGLHMKEFELVLLCNSHLWVVCISDLLWNAVFEQEKFKTCEITKTVFFFQKRKWAPLSKTIPFQSLIFVFLHSTALVSGEKKYIDKLTISPCSKSKCFCRWFWSKFLKCNDIHVWESWKVNKSNWNVRFIFMQRYSGNEGLFTAYFPTNPISLEQANPFSRNNLLEGKL